MPSCFSLDFDENTICTLADEYAEYKNTEEIRQFIAETVYPKLFENNEYESSYDGKRWHIELIFEKKYILHLSGFENPSDIFINKLNNLPDKCDSI